MKTILAAAVFALSISAPALAQQADWSQTGDHYAIGNTVVQQPTPQELNQAKEGDYYAASKTVVEQPAPQQLRQDREGDYYAPAKGN
jgi:hypothetical protein